MALTAIAGGLQHRASAEVIAWTDRAAWSSASSGLTTITFAGLGGDPNDEPDTGYPSGLGIDGVTFSNPIVDSPPYLYVRTQNPQNFLYGPPDPTLCYGVCQAFPPGSGIEVTLPAGTTSVGWDFANFYASGLFGSSYSTGLQVVFADGSTYENGYTGGEFPGFGGPQFVGFTSSTPITSFEIMGPGFPTVQNFAFGQASEVDALPEPRCGMLIGLLLAGCVLLRSRTMISQLGSKRRAAFVVQ